MDNAMRYYSFFTLLCLGLGSYSQAAPSLQSLEARITQQEKALAALKRDVRALRLSHAPKPSSSSTYIVQKGDSLSQIASRHKVSMSAIKSANKLNKNTIFVGQKLVLPTRNKPQSSLKRKTLSTHSTAKGVYIVQKGDNLHKISRNQGISFSRLLAYNPQLKKPYLIEVGDTIALHSSRISAKEHVHSSPKTIKKIAQAPSKPTTKVKNNDLLDVSILKTDKYRVVTIEHPMTYKELAKRYNTTTETLNRINTQDLSSDILLAAGSDFCVPR